MAWTSPATYVTGTILQASQLNLTRDNLLETAPAKVTTAGDLVVATGANALARLAVGAQNTAVRGGTTPTYVSDDTTFPWDASVDVLGAAPYSTTGWTTTTIDPANLVYGGWLGSSAQNDEAIWNVLLAAGTWRMRLWITRDSGQGRYHLYIDGAAQNGGAFIAEGYAATNTKNVSVDYSGIVIATTHLVAVRLRMETKHASSSGYGAELQHIHFRRTA